MSTEIAPVTMDSRKFLANLNDSVQAKVAFIESKIAQMGKQANKDWALAALRNTNLYIEDRTDNTFYQADYHREKGGKIVIENIKPVDIVEGEKSKLFQESCYDLVCAIETNDPKGMATAFNKMAGQRFSSRAVPYSGKVRTRDGVVRTINLQDNKCFDESTKISLAALVCEALRDNIIIKDGLVVEASFTDGKPLRLPVTKWSKHKLVARTMREAAQNAYWSKGFQTRIYSIASLLHEDKIDDAVKLVAPFLQEYEEFTLLTRDQTKTLIENALAASGIFNQALCENTALLFYRTNHKVNKDTMVREWRRIAKAAQHPALLENTNILGRTKNFEAAADKFLELVFEAMSNRDVTAEALATTLQVLKDRTPKIKESHELASKLDDLINRLKSKEFDDNSIYEAEDFIATVQEELTMGEDLQNFDEIPGGSELPAEPNAEGAALGSELSAEKSTQSTPGVVFNAPLIQIGDAAAEALGLGGEEEGEDELSDEDLSGMAAGADQEAMGAEDDLMAGGGAAAAGGGPPGFGMESKGRKNKAITEKWDEKKYGEAPWKKKKDKDKDKSDEDEVESESIDSDDPYALKETIQIDHSVGSDYGAPAITNTSDIARVVTAMAKLAESNNLTGKALQESIADLALAGFEATGMRIPPRKLNNAIDQVATAFNETVTGTDAIADNPDALGDDDDPLGVDDEPVEDQYKWGTIRRKGGFKRGAIGQREKKAKNEGITWHHAQDDAILGEMAGVKFVFDHGGNTNLKPVILSEDGQSEVPIPTELYDSAFAAAKMTKGDPAPFTAWLYEGIEQLRPESPEETDALDAEVDEPGPSDELEDAAGEMGTAQDSMAAAGEDLADAGDEMGPVDDAMGPMDDELGGEDELAGDLAGDLVGDEEGLGGGSTVTITTNPKGGVKIDVKSPSVEINQGEDLAGGLDAEPGLADPASAVDDVAGAMGPDMGGEEDLDGVDEMQPVDSVTPPPGGAVGAPGEDELGVGGEGEEEFPNFEDEGVVEDEDLTSPKSSKYTKIASGDKRDEPEVKLPGKSGNELKGFGKTPKETDKAGTKVGPAKKSSDD